MLYPNIEEPVVRTSGSWVTRPNFLALRGCILELVTTLNSQTVLVLALGLLLSTPAMADGAFDIFLILVTGGPLAALPIAAYGIYCSRRVRPGLPLILSVFLAVVGAGLGYWLGFEIAEYRVAQSQYRYGGLVGFYAPMAILFSAGLTCLPSAILSYLWPSVQRAEQGERTL